MSIELTTVLLFGGLLILLALGVPVVFALGGISVLVTFLIGGPNDLYIVATTTYRQITDPGLITIPLFMHYSQGWGLFAVALMALGTLALGLRTIERRRMRMR